jgi:uncharacterized repeat protein (TIGR01451 family)
MLALVALVALAAAVAPADAAQPEPPAQGTARSRSAGDLEPTEATSGHAVEREAGLKLFGAAGESETYLIRLVDPAVPSYRGGESGLAPTEPAPGTQLDAESGPARAYRGHLEEAQAEFIQRMERTTERDVDVLFRYQYAVNGIAAVLTAEEARAIADDPAVASIAPDQERVLHTDAGPLWQNADALWNAAPELGLPTDIRGEGVVIGVIDTGINPSNPSFADIGDDGYDHTNPLGDGVYLGACDATNVEQYDPSFPCNDKLIGAYTFVADEDTPRDYDGHGSHTASTSGGNVVDDVVVAAPTLTTPPFDISGVAPHANIVAYLGCCTLAGLTGAIDQAIADEVDVINYSIGSSSPSAAWDDFDTLGFLNARSAGIFVAVSNGNDGPLPETTGSPADAPWLTAVGASTHNRHNGNVLTNLTSSEGPLPDIAGKSVTGALLEPAPIVDAASVGDPFCLDDSGHEPAFTGHIVVCTRGGGGGGRVEKSRFVAAQGAVGFVLVNDELHAASLLGDQYALPGVFISYADGQTLKAWLATGTLHEGAIAGTAFTIDDARGDIMASFSSRGPNRAMDTIVPSVTAPGVDILAALGVGDPDPPIHGFISGTSMSSPHVAGAGALLTQARPAWTPAQMQSALMTTARPTVLNHDGTLATPYAQGSGHVDVGAATLAGLLFDETLEDYLAANPDEGGDPKTLNLPSFADFQCLAICTWEREATVPLNPLGSAPVPDDVTWTASATSDAGLTVGVTLTPATVSPGDDMGIAVTADVTGAPTGETLFGRITLTPSNSSVPAVTMPVAVVPASSVLPDAIDIETRRNAGSQLVPDIRSIAVSELTTSMAGMVKATIAEASLDEDPTRDDPYDDLSQVDVRLVEVPPGATRLVTEILDAAMPDADLFVGTGDTPSPETEVCVSATGSALEGCDLPDPEPGTWWILVQNWEGSDAQPDEYTLASGVVPGTDLGNAGVAGPAGPIPTGQPYDVRVHWDIPEMVAGDIWYGMAILGSSPATPGDIGSIPVTLRRAADDVAKAASVEEATNGDTIDYEITVQPNITDSDLVYTVVDTVPEGLTVDPGSVSGGGVVEGQTITWQVPMPTTSGQTGTYVASVPADDPQCAAWSGFLDLADLDIGFASLDGDTASANAFSGIGPFEHYGQQFANLVVAEDGLVTVAGGYDGPDTEPWTPQEIPDASFPNGVIAPLWSDLELSLVNGRGIRLAQDATTGVAVVQWENAFEFGGDPTDPASSVGTFQAWIYNTAEEFRPEMTFEYGELGALPGVATIGVEDILGQHATAVLAAGDPSPILTEGGTICLDYVGPSIEPTTLTYSVTVDPGAAPGTYTNSAVHVTDDPFAQPVTVSESVVVSRTCAQTITGLRFEPVTASSGTTCIQGALLLGGVTVAPGAGVYSTNSLVLGSLGANGATEVTLCNTWIVGFTQVSGSSAARLGDPLGGCHPNLLLAPVWVTGTSGPSVIAGNIVVGWLTCTGNSPPPVNNGWPNLVFGLRTDQCAAL